MSQKFYVKSTQVDGIKITPPQDNKIRYHFYKNFPPPYYILIGVIIKIVRVIREGVLLHFSPPLAGGGKVKINLNSDSG